MSGGDGSDDGKPESVPIAVVRPAGIETLERLKQAVDVARRNESPRVGHAEHGAVIVGLGDDFDVAIDDIVADGVIDQIGREPLDE